ncbi:MAG: hypothetical protein LKE41_02075 [Prevotella sp.]|jgi:hypothetical protein|nr:hypothetical protein [Prevotella sp.]HCN54695.1 hypothetical protein [Prevotella sp.]
MEQLKFKVTLLSDVIISESPATQGRHRGLDFIPGNNFLGIAASRLYKDIGENTHTYLLFHNGHVRFGDANPGYKGIRGLRTPSCFFKAKYTDKLPWKDGDKTRLVHHRITDFKPYLDAQLKQCRSGFMVFEDKTAYEISLSRNYAIKSAYDSEKRRAEDEKLFGYESLTKGSVLYFCVELDDDAMGCKDEMINALTGLRHVGRSRSAQFGLVKIEPFNYQDVSACSSEKGQVVVYADSRLCFFDAEGQPTMCPTAEQLGVKGGQIDWSKSQIRTFQYAPWNYQRQAFDDERCGIENGSVFVIKGTTDATENIVGAYQNEGFGKVLYNPSFLMTGENGKSLFTFEQAMEENGNHKADEDWTQHFSNTTLLSYLKNKKTLQKEEKTTYDLVDDFVKAHKERFSAITPSQWGTIRGIAMSADQEEKIIGFINTFIHKGVAKDYWEERGRGKKLIDFLEKNRTIVSVRDLVINLSSEMAKEKNR